MSSQETRKYLQDISGGNVGALKKFKSVYPNVHFSSLRYEFMRDSVLHVAARLGQLDIITFLLTHYTPNGVNIKNNDNKTPLHEAAQFVQFEAIKILVENGADVNVLKKSDWTPLMLACTRIKDENKNLEIVKYLVEKGALIDYQNKDGWSALHLIVREPASKILSYLIEQKIDLMKLSKNGRSALHVACLHSNLDAVNLLIRNNADVNLKDLSGNTPILEAVLGGDINVLNLLIQHKADVNVRNKADYSALHLAASVSGGETIKYIINTFNISANVTTNLGLTPLHCAAKNNNEINYNILKELGADDSIKDNFGRTPKEYFKAK